MKTVYSIWPHPTHIQEASHCAVRIGHAVVSVIVGDSHESAVSVGERQEVAIGQQHSSLGCWGAHLIARARRVCPGGHQKVRSLTRIQQAHCAAVGAREKIAVEAVERWCGNDISSMSNTIDQTV